MLLNDLVLLNGSISLFYLRIEMQLTTTLTNAVPRKLRQG